MNPQTCTEFGANRSIRLAAFPDLNLWPPKTPRNAPCGIEGRIVFSYVHSQMNPQTYQIWCQSVEQFDSFLRHLNLWPPKPTPHPQNAPWGMVPIGPAVWQLLQTFESLTPKCPPCVSTGNLFGVYPFPDESAHVCQIWCQSVQPFDSFNRLLNLWPPKTPKMPPGILRCELYLAYVHSQTNPQTCTKCGANQSSCLTASQDFLICDPPPP